MLGRERKGGRECGGDVWGRRRGPGPPAGNGLEKGTGEGVTRWERKGDCRDLGSQWWAGDSVKRRNRLRPKGWGKAYVRAGAVDKGLGVGLGSDFGLT